VSVSSAFEHVAVVGGCGHVGLPLGLLFAGSGKQVTLIDINEAAVARVNRGEMPFLEAGAPQLLAKVLSEKRLRATTDARELTRAQAVVLVTGTPVDEHLNPDTATLDLVIGTFEPHLRAEQLLVMRSTVYPGTTERVARHLQQRLPGIDVAFCPERIAQGHALEESSRLPQIISGTTPRAAQRARDLFHGLADSMLELSPTEAELAKLFTNAWRYLSFAASNQFYTMANDLGLDFYRIYKAMVQDYPRMSGFAPPGFAAGPCLFKDTMQLAAFSNNSFFLGHAAMLVNEGLPNYLVRCLKRRLDLSKQTVGILGMAFKADNDDPRESLSYKLRKMLSLEAAGVLCSDPFIKDPSFVAAEDLVARCDLILLGTPHSAYRKLDLGGKPAVDIWNLWGRGGIV